MSNRLSSSQLTVNGQTAINLSLGYDAIGNITSKYGVGTYTYDPNRPHAIQSISGTVNTTYTYTYDANGNTLSGNGKSYGWTGFNKPFEIVEGNNKTDFWYGPDRARYQQVATVGGATTTTLYIGGAAKIITQGTLTTYKYLIAANGETIAVETQRNNGTQALRYLSYDGLGSLDVITDESGGVVARLSFDAFGRRRDTTAWSGSPSNLNTITDITPIGFIGHEHVVSGGLAKAIGFIFDVNDTLLAYQGIPTASGVDAMWTGANMLRGHSLGALDVGNLQALGQLGSSSLYALPFGFVAPGGSSVTNEWDDPISGFVFGLVTNPDAHMHMPCGTWIPHDYSPGFSSCKH